MKKLEQSITSKRAIILATALLFTNLIFEQFGIKLDSDSQSIAMQVINGAIAVLLFLIRGWRLVVNYFDEIKEEVKDIKAKQVEISEMFKHTNFSRKLQSNILNSTNDIIRIKELKCKELKSAIIDGSVSANKTFAWVLTNDFDVNEENLKISLYSGTKKIKTALESKYLNIQNKNAFIRESKSEIKSHLDTFLFRYSQMVEEELINGIRRGEFKEMAHKMVEGICENLIDIYNKYPKINNIS